MAAAETDGQGGTLHGLLIEVAYDGRPFHGFAAQRDQRTVAGELLGAAQALDPRITEIRGASRTDARVHARAHAVAFDTRLDISTRGVCLALAQHLPDEIAVVSAARVAPGFSPRFSNRGKRYRYLLLASPVRDPFWEGRALRVAKLDATTLAKRIEAELASAVGTHDFKAFRTASDARAQTTRTLGPIDVDLDPSDPRIVRVTIEGTAFLHNMVRILVGTGIDVALRHIPEGAIARAIASGNRRDAGFTAAPEGLYLEEVLLDDRGTDRWPPRIEGGVVR